MTGPEHYQRAEDLLDLLGRINSDDPNRSDIGQQAQAHATLALAAATACSDGGPARVLPGWSVVR